MGNLLTGSLPSSMSALTALQYIDLSNNGLSSSLPPALQYLTNLQYLDMSSQAGTTSSSSDVVGLNGTLPSEYSSLTAHT